jgi:hypothetical protein
MSVDTGRVDRVWIYLLKSEIVLAKLFGIFPSLILHVIFDTNVCQFFLSKKLVDLLLHSFDWRLHQLGQVSEENGVFQKVEVGEVLELFASGEELKIMLKCFGEFLVEDRQSREVDKEITNVSIIEHFLDEFATILGVLDSRLAESSSSLRRLVEELVFLNHREVVVVDLDDAVIRVVRRVVHGCVLVEGL